MERELIAAVITLSIGAYVFLFAWAVIHEDEPFWRDVTDGMTLRFLWDRQ